MSTIPSFYSSGNRNSDTFGYLAQITKLGYSRAKIHTHISLKAEPFNFLLPTLAPVPGMGSRDFPRHSPAAFTLAMPCMAFHKDSVGGSVQASEDWPLPAKLSGLLLKVRH